jgi:hypothetical protein
MPDTFVRDSQGQSWLVETDAEQKTREALEAVERRDYTYCTATYPDPLTFRKFIVLEPRSRQAMRRAMQYATARWGKPEVLRIYPRNYVRKARALAAAGDFTR